jgi:2-enoate reductase
MMKMATKYTNLFSPIRIGGIEVPNRLAMMPMGVFTPRLINSRNGAYTKDGADYYIERAKGGTGLIITGLVPILPSYILNPVNAPEAYIAELKYLTDGVHRYGSKVFIQMSALTGRSGHADSEEELDRIPAPAPIQNVWDPTLKNRGITVEEIKQYIKNFAEAASLVQKAGGDGVEIHAIHEGYLLDQFAIDFFNRRSDEYGGTLENRLRFAKEIVAAIKEKCGKDFPVSMRYSVRSYVKDFNRGALPGEKFIEKGRGPEEGVQVAKMLESYGYDLLNCDNGSYDSWFWPHPPTYMPKACNLDDVAQVKQAVGIPVVCAGKFDNPDVAEQAIAQGRVDIMGMGRPLLADPELGKKFFEGRLSDVRPCIGCHQGCLGRIFQGKDISCAVNPACGREISYALTSAAQKKKVMVIGGGLGGMEAARICALRGHEVDLFEKTEELGGAFLAAAAPEFKDDDRKLLAWYKKQIQELPVKVRMHTEVTEDMIKGYDEIVVATGAHERKLDAPGFDAPNVTYAIDTLRNIEIRGDNVVIVGGGLTGCEIAYMLGKEGKKVTVVEKTETILNAFGLSAANYNMLMELMDYYKVNVIKNAVVEEFKDGIATVTETVKNYPNVANRAKRMFALGPDGIPKKHKIPADHVVVSVGYISDNGLFQRIQGDHVHLIGDAKKPTNIMEAIWAAYETAMVL